MAILTILINVLVMENMSKIHFSKCKCHGGYDGDPHDFYQCSGQSNREEVFLGRIIFTKTSSLENKQ